MENNIEAKNIKFVDEDGDPYSNPVFDKKTKFMPLPATYDKEEVPLDADGYPYDYG